MTLDDRSLREHLERRALAGATDISKLGDAVVARLPDAAAPSPWHRQLGIGSAVGIAAAAVVVALIGISLLPGSLAPGSGASASATPTVPASASPFESPTSSDVPALEYPTGRAMTVDELVALLAETPEERAGTVIIAAVERELIVQDAICLKSCPRYLVRTATRDIRVFAAEDPVVGLMIDGTGALALQVRVDGDLDLLGVVRAGPDGLAWTLPQLTEVLPEMRASYRAVPYLYVVNAVRAVSDTDTICGSRMVIDQFFGCGPGSAWLVPDETGLVSGSKFAPPGSLRVPNVPGIRDRIDAVHQPGFWVERASWLVNPWVTPVACSMCPTAGAADLLGRVLPFSQLRSTPAPGTSPG